MSFRKFEAYLISLPMGTCLLNGILRSFALSISHAKGTYRVRSAKIWSMVYVLQLVLEPIMFMAKVGLASYPGS